jgi:hypothetical protein
MLKFSITISGVFAILLCSTVVSSQVLPDPTLQQDLGEPIGFFESILIWTQNAGTRLVYIGIAIAAFLIWRPIGRLLSGVHRREEERALRLKDARKADAEKTHGQLFTLWVPVIIFAFVAFQIYLLAYGTEEMRVNQWVRYVYSNPELRPQEPTQRTLRLVEIRSQESFNDAGALTSPVFLRLAAEKASPTLLYAEATCRWPVQNSEEPLATITPLVPSKSTNEHFSEDQAEIGQLEGRVHFPDGYLLKENYKEALCLVSKLSSI